MKRLLILTVLFMSIVSVSLSEVLSGSGMGYYDDIYVLVTTEGEKIVAIDVTDCRDTPGIADNAIEGMPIRIIEAQSLEVDTVAGATYTSKGILEAVEDALSKK